MPKKELLTPFFRKHLWAIPIYGLISLIFSPIIILTILVIKNTEDIKDYYKQCFDTFKKFE